ncbi:MAG: methionyl-tRNA formyltransferase [Gammaproteobacteria bacterium]|nr:methionyl-tRNA formyltransferase [Gammaproteobacteria bacterium]NNF50539.1 methionyl-tRNA formyltransferase [Woeseiaceae bacterium]MBT8093338.1 methionyl-tRNA formyltransferase [Gammaproteobacteria bacterium]MBT8104407.1 methionyl-tRNA formyltransferase [Gammaproteobacteria bacterium]NNK24423.1 methionyl-tRNA formyltransferase [Woeseiaceae bacterium]
MTRLVFAGTPEFGRASLEALVEAGRAPVAVYTQPDRPAGRGRKLSASPVKRFAEAHGIPVLQPATLRSDEAVEELATLEPDLLIVAAYGLILPQAVLDVPKHGCLNVHASVLPRWRGAAPIQAAILAGDATTGISLMAMTAGLDCGPVFHSEEIAIGADETAGELHDRLAALGGQLLVARLDAILAGDIEAREQDESLATHAPKIDKRDAEIDWLLPAADVARRIRAYNPFPGAYTHVRQEPAPTSSALPQGTRLKIWRASVTDGEGEPGTVLQFDRDAVVVACGEDALRLEELQLPGRRRAPAREFVGQADLAGVRLN